MLTKQRQCLKIFLHVDFCRPQKCAALAIRLVRPVAKPTLLSSELVSNAVVGPVGVVGVFGVFRMVSVVGEVRVIGWNGEVV